jgi:hypothetical protein
VVRAAGGVSNRDKEKQYVYKQVYKNYRLMARIKTVASSRGRETTDQESGSVPQVPIAKDLISPNCWSKFNIFFFSVSPRATHTAGSKTRPNSSSVVLPVARAVLSRCW